MPPIRDCQRCPALVRTRSCVVNGAGIRDAKIAMVGEGPGEFEDKKRRPFVGKAGRVLKAIEWAAGIDQYKVFHTNATRCWGKRNPKPAEVDACHDHLIQELRELNPTVIVALGGAALRSLYRPGITVGSVMGFTLYNDELPGIPLIGTYHPSYIMRGHWDEAALVLSHFRKAKRIAESEDWREELGSYTGITTLDDLRALRDYLLGPEVESIAVDTETTGLSWMDSELLCISFSGEEGFGFSVPILHRGERTIMKMAGRGKNRKEVTETEWWPVPYWTPDEIGEVYTILDEILRSDVPKSGQNIGFDLRMLERRADEVAVKAKTTLGYYVNNVQHDTRLLSSLLSEVSPANLTVLTAYWTDIPYYEGAQIEDLTFHQSVDKLYRECVCAKLTATQTVTTMHEVCATFATKESGTPNTQEKPVSMPDDTVRLTKQITLDAAAATGSGKSIDSPKKTMTFSTTSKKGSVSYAELLQKDAWMLTLTMLQDELGVSSVPDATLQSAGLEILWRLYNAHSPTCAAIEYLQLTPRGIRKNFPGISQFKSKMWHLPDKLLHEYGGADVDVVQTLVPQLYPKVQEEGTQWVYENISIPLIRCATKLEERGIYIDRDYFDKLCRYYKDHLKAKKAELNETVGRKVEHPTHYQHVQQLVFKDLGLPLTSGATDGAIKDCDKCRRDSPCSPAHASTSADALEELNERDPHPVLPLLIDIRSGEKFYSTYLEGGEGGGFRAHIREDGRIHARWNAARAATGRFSCENPNLMNPPKGVKIHSDEYDIHSDDAIRSMFTAPPGYGILSADWSQAEVWVMAYETGDERLLKLLMEGTDVHAHVARELCKLGVSGAFPHGIVDEALSLDEWKSKYKEVRDRGKVFVFGMNYGLTDEGAGQRLGCSKEEAAPLLAHYVRNIFPSMGAYFIRIREEMFQRGSVANRFGRRRHFPEVPILAALRFRGDLEGAVRQGFNMPIQGGAHDLHSLAHIATEREMSSFVFPVLELHDELAMEAPEDRLEEAAAAIQELWGDVARNTILPSGERLAWDIPVSVQWGRNFGALRTDLNE